MNLQEFHLSFDGVTPTGTCICRFDRYVAWSDTPKGFIETLTNKGRIEFDPPRRSFETVPFPGKNYWDPDYPIALEYFPQTDAEVLQCPKCKAIFLAYTEESGHFPQHRIRWVRPELIYNT